jgi:hypothetical protein
MDYEEDMSAINDRLNSLGTQLATLREQMFWSNRQREKAESRIMLGLVLTWIAVMYLLVQYVMLEQRGL